jgi:two-component system cell cycle sensor histidine kinase/response regulator CckA
LWADPDNHAKAVAQLMKNGSLRNWEFRFCKKNGDFGAGLLSAELIEIEGERCVITATVDINERLQLESQLRQSQRLESVGRLAGGVAHDFNNLLTVINGYSGLILAALRPHDPLYLPAEAIKKAGERAASLTKQLLAFSRRQVIEPRPLNLNTIVNDAERMLRRLIGEDITLTTVLDPLSGWIMADPDQIHQVIINLVVNARDAMPDGGELTITTRNVDIDGSFASLHSDAVPGRYVLMTVRDTGIGMDEKTLQNAFEPFFTTKECGKGTGLGLATVYGIVQQGGGWIHVWSAVGHGTAFDIYLPRVDACPVPDRAASSMTETLHGSETVLIVEDDKEVRTLAATILRAYGYHVLEAANGSEAFVVEKEHPGDIHLLLTDVILPGMNGKMLSERLKALRPNLKVLFTSGYTADVITTRGLLERDLAYLPKPFSPDTLACKVREVLTEAAA